jgi:hypothetical protein
MQHLGLLNGIGRAGISGIESTADRRQRRAAIRVQQSLRGFAASWIHWFALLLEQRYMIV